MKKALSLILALALICSLSLAGAENSHINTFLVNLFKDLGSIDLDTQQLKLVVPRGPQALVERKDGLLNAWLQTNSGSYYGSTYTFQMDDEKIWAADSTSGYYMTLDDLNKVIEWASGSEGEEKANLLEDYKLLYGKGIDVLVRECVRTETKDGKYTVTATLDSETGYKVLYAYLDAVVSDEKALNALMNIYRAVKSEPLKSLLHVGDESLDTSFREVFGIPEGGAVTAESVKKGWEETKDQFIEKYRQRTEELKKYSYYSETGYELQLALNDKGDFDSLTLTVRIDTWDSYGGNRQETHTVELAYEGSDLVVLSDNKVYARVRAESDDEVQLYTMDYYGTEQLAGKATLRQNNEFWTLTVTDARGSTIGTLSTGRQSTSVTKLSDREDSLQKVDLDYLKEQFGIDDTAAPSATPEPVVEEAVVEIPVATDVPAAVTEAVSEAVDSTGYGY